MNAIPFKQCTACAKEFPATTEFFTRNKKGKDGLFTQCKTCKNKKQKERWNQLETRQIMRNQRKEYYQKNRDQVLARQKEYTQTHSDAISEQKKAYYQKNADEIKANVHNYRKNNAENIKHHKRAYRQANLDKIREKGKQYSQQNKEQMLQNHRRWRENNREYFNLQSKAYCARRRARKLQIPGSYTVPQWNDLKKSYDYTCLCCQKKEPEIKLTPDHIIPLAKQGANTILNIQPLCLNCNLLKGTQIKDYRPNMRSIISTNNH